MGLQNFSYPVPPRGVTAPQLSKNPPPNCTNDKERFGCQKMLYKDLGQT